MKASISRYTGNYEYVAREIMTIRSFIKVVALFSVVAVFSTACTRSNGTCSPDDGVILQRNARFAAAPLGNRGVSKELDSEEIRELNLERRASRVVPSDRRAASVADVTDGVTADNDVDLLRIVSRPVKAPRATG